MRAVIEYKDLIWIDIIEPTEEDLLFIKNKFRLHPITLKTIIPHIHHPDFDVFRSYILIVLHYLNSKTKEDTEVQEIDIIAGENYLITNHYQFFQPLNDIFCRCLKSDGNKEEYMGKGMGFLLFALLNKILKEKLVKIDKLEDEIDSIEKTIFLEKERETVKNISYLKREILSFWRVVEPQKIIFESLKNIGPKFFGKEFSHYFSVLFRFHQKTETVLRNLKETIESLEATNKNLITLKTNETIKVLTLFSATMLPLTLLASLWGMNTNFLPFSNTSLDFLAIIFLMIVISVGMLFYFKSKKWL